MISSIAYMDKSDATKIINELRTASQDVKELLKENNDFSGLNKLRKIL